ncbi:pre-B lymphocyte protein 3 [Psammomys obesus]|uniref:pre-B lymphocyte protein 3 n=1 Tax=Psammomys obesus TaxID=48139 RepID=UPI00245286DB|nr:pre-B lymphocyte protein 3 [Psammomys obesus]
MHTSLFSQWADLHALLWLKRLPRACTTSAQSPAQQNHSRTTFLLMAVACPGCLLLLMGAFLAVFQPALMEPDALLVFPGQVAQLSCTINSQHATVGDTGVSWYQQQPGSAPHFLYYHSKEEHYRPDDVPDRFSATMDMAHNACVLTISPVQPEDDAHYFCSIYYSSEP